MYENSFLLATSLVSLHIKFTEVDVEIYYFNDIFNIFNKFVIVEAKLKILL